MGESKRRAGLREARFKFSKPMKRARFNVLAIGTRHANLFGLVHEVSWWASTDEQLLGTVLLDHTDDDFNPVILARDELGRFRCVDVLPSFQKQFHAEEALRFKIAEHVEEGKLEELGRQGDVTNAAINLFQLPTDLRLDNLHPYFLHLLNDPGKAPARAVIKEIGPWLAPNDPHLAQEFQTKGFDQRLWEIFLWAAFRDSALQVEQLEAPDFRCYGRGEEFTVEATTVAPSHNGVLAAHPNPKTREETEVFLKDYMAMKYGSALISKLSKTNKAGEHYWERGLARGRPFAIAIADFHEPPEKEEIGSMTYTQSALWNYLYGHRVLWEMQGDQIVVREVTVKQHSFGQKMVSSGFFDQPNAENVSAVIFSNAGTLAKFDRMGVAAGFGPENYRYHRIGLKYDPNPDALMGIPFSVDVSDPDYEEFWTQELQVFHNPNAKIPLPFSALLGASHHYFENGTLRSFIPDDAILSSMTMVIRVVGEDEKSTPAK